MSVLRRLRNANVVKDSMTLTDLEMRFHQPNQMKIYSILTLLTLGSLPPRHAYYPFFGQRGGCTQYTRAHP